MTNNENPPKSPVERFDAGNLTAFASALLQRAGLPDDRAETVAEILVEADLMGHSTHGLQLLPAYLKELDAGTMTKAGDPTVISDQDAAITWDGRYLPGPWLVVRAMDQAFHRISAHPVITIAIRQSHHIGCLAAYLMRATDRGLLMLLATSDPSGRSVAPFGGVQPTYTPNPLAAGIPTQGDPILIDISMSTTAMGVVSRANQQGQRLDHPWLIDNQGNPSDNPADLYVDPPGSILPLGGIDLGYKGFALGIIIETLTSALAGQGRSAQPNRWGSSVFLQIIDPNAFGGYSNFIQETEWFAQVNRESKPKPGGPPVRLPGQRGLQLRAEQLQHGVALYPTILPALRPWIEKLEVPLPPPISGQRTA
jgi:LDH2 family malate/lactate/ureidoglycolate dehydrogenase